MTGSTYYFAYGSNMLTSRMRLQNPTAERIGAGKLMNYRLDFYLSSDKWYGAAATIMPSKGSCVYGTIWRMRKWAPEDLDKKEGVPEGIYLPMTAVVRVMNTTKYFNCRVYYLTIQPPFEMRRVTADQIPYDRKPSMTYLKAMVKGAMESGLPKEYVNWLRCIKHNGTSEIQFEKYLGIQHILLIWRS